MFKYNTVGVKCPGCDTLVAQRVLVQDYKEGKVVLTCHVCGQRIYLEPPEPFFQMYMRENARLMKMYGDVFRRMGWGTLILLIIWGIGWLIFERWLGWPRWVAALVPGLPFLYLFFRTLGRAMKERIREDLGVARSSTVYEGMRETDAIKVYSIDEEYHFLASRRCPACNGLLKPGVHSIAFSKADAERIARKRSPRLDKMYDHIEGICQQCNRKWVFYFDIDQIDYVKKMGYTQEMVMFHMQSVAKRLQER